MLAVGATGSRSLINVAVQKGATLPLVKMQDGRANDNPI